ncbi:MAG: group 1 truncated hemoglobin [Verrucomicrobiales bacterium]|nr:group 1 truncated hemoglobin [Verrucomicrobiales bacterium]
MMSNDDGGDVGGVGGVTLYERVGGGEVVGELVERFYARVLKDEELMAFFEGTEMEGLKRMLAMFVCAALDGPIEYSGRPLGHVHQGKGIKIHHFQRFVELMMEEFWRLKLSEKDEYEVLGRMAKYADVITGGQGVDG